MEWLSVSFKNGVRLIKFNKPGRNNAMDETMYREIARILNTDAGNDNVVITIFTGCGQYFSSGNDLKAGFESTSSGDEKLEGVNLMIKALINYPKLIIAVVNGPAIGIGATMTGLCDIVYATDKAYFQTPFVNLGLSIEGCSSVLFPSILGKSKALEVLLLNHKLTAQEAYQFGLVSKVIPHYKLDEFIEELHKFGSLPVKSLIINKELIKSHYQTTLLECNEQESKTLYECVTSEEFLNNVMKFLSKKSKL